MSLIEQMALHLSRAINVIVHISLRPATVPKPPKDRQPEKKDFFNFTESFVKIRVLF